MATLKQVLERMDPDSIVSIGAKSGYFYIGTVRGFVPSRYRVVSLAQVAKRYKQVIEDDEEALSEYEGCIENCLEALASGPNKYFTDEMERCKREISKTELRIRRTTAALNKIAPDGKVGRTLPLMKREVIDMFPSAFPDYGMRLIIQGEEPGGL